MAEPLPAAQAEFLKRCDEGKTRLSLLAQEICRLAGNLQLLSTIADSKAEPGIIVYRGEKGWRIAVTSR